MRQKISHKGKHSFILRKDTLAPGHQVFSLEMRSSCFSGRGAPMFCEELNTGLMKLTGSWVITMWMVLCMGKHKMKPNLVRLI
jgi:hypothetical protein